MSNYTFVENDTGAELRVTCTEGDNETPIDLTQATVVLRWKGSESDEAVERTMGVYGDSALGVATYVFQANELVSPMMTFELQITDAAGNVRTSLDSFSERVRTRIS
jgi:hypothetical protein